jgi:hypothetical protein
MVAVVSVETVLLVILLVLVAGLLRSHAEILRRLESGEGSGLTASPPATPSRTPGQPAPPIVGPTPSGDALSLDFSAAAAQPTLLAFLTSGCSTCAGFWETLSEPRLPDGVATLIVTHGRERERPARLRELQPRGVPVVMSSEAWEAYAVPGSPYFVLVEQTIKGEGAATTWSALSSLVADAVVEERESGPARAAAAEDKLAVAGIGPGHPSLYPGGEEVRS